MKLMTLGDKILIAILMFISIFSMFYISGSAIGGSSGKVIVQVDGNQVAKFHINMDKQPRNYDFKFGENTGTIQMQEGRVRMLPMDLDICPGKVCSDTGWIQKSYQMIVCLPNKIMVTIESKEENNIDI